MSYSVLFFLVAQPAIVKNLRSGDDGSFFSGNSLAPSLVLLKVIIRVPSPIYLGCCLNTLVGVGRFSNVSRIMHAFSTNLAVSSTAFRSRPAVQNVSHCLSVITFSTSCKPAKSLSGSFSVESEQHRSLDFSPRNCPSS